LDTTSPSIILGPVSPRIQFQACQWWLYSALNRTKRNNSGVYLCIVRHSDCEDIRCYFSYIE